MSGPALTVYSVVADSPAERAGLLTGDVLVAVEGQPVVLEGEARGRRGRTTIRPLEAALREAPDALRLTVRRHGQDRDIDLAPAPRPEGFGHIVTNKLRDGRHTKQWLVY